MGVADDFIYQYGLKLLSTKTQLIDTDSLLRLAIETVKEVSNDEFDRREKLFGKPTPELCDVCNGEGRLTDNLGREVKCYHCEETEGD